MPGGLTLRERMAKWSPEAKGAGLMLVSAVLTGIAAHHALSIARADPGLGFSAGGVDVQGLPAWLDPESTAALRAASAVPGRIHVLDRAPLRRLREYYLANEWVASVERLEYAVPGAEGGGGITGRLRLRDPMCLVGLRAGEYYFADTEGRRLGGVLSALPPADLRLPVIQWAKRVPPRGEAWGGRKEFARADEPVLHGFYIAALLAQAGLRENLPHWIARIDVRNVGRNDWSEVELVTEPGHAVRLQWGRTARSELVFGRVQESPVAEKIERLRRILAGERLCRSGEEVLLFEPGAAGRDRGP
ncbi:MAG TPA: hypothetical protein DCM87_14055 [Planctomycetes bacterium]|nr:hypothetical protein [Planctomycetota bacterium]